MSWPDEVMEDYTRERCRFRLVEIAYKEIMRKKFPEWEDGTIARWAVLGADAVLAAMDKSEDTGPSADATALGTERVLAVLAELRAELQKILDGERQYGVDNPIASKQDSGYRCGAEYAYVVGLDCIDRAIAKTKREPQPETENDETH